MMTTYSENQLVLVLLKNGVTVAGRYVEQASASVQVLSQQTQPDLQLRTPVVMQSQPDPQGRVHVGVLPFFPVGLCSEAADRNAVLVVNKADVMCYLTPSDTCERAYAQVTSGIQLA